MPVADGGLGPRCTRIKLNGDRCKLPPIKGATVCGSHGGRSPNVRRKAAERIALAKAQADLARAAAKHGKPGSPDPLAALEGALADVWAVKERLGGIVGRLDDASLRHDHRAGEQLRGELQAYLATLRDVTRTAEVMLKLDLAGRRQALDEQSARVLVEVIRAILDQLQLSPEQRVIAGQVVPEQLRAASEQSLAQPAIAGRPNNPGDRRR